MSLLLLLNPAATISVERAPFSERSIADRVQEDPEAYRRLAACVASLLQRDIDRLDAITPGSDANSVAVIKGELKRWQEGFQEVSTTIPHEGVLTREAAERVGSIISTLRVGFAAWYEGNKEIAEGAQKLLSVVLATFALHQFGVSLDLAAIIASAAMVNGHKEGKK
jgi:hypothetical protein